MRSSTVPPFGLKVLVFPVLYESRAQCHRQAHPWRLIGSTTRTRSARPAACRRTATDEARLLNPARCFGFLLALICQRFVFEQRLGVKGLDFDRLLLDHGHVFAAGLALRLVLGAG